MKYIMMLMALNRIAKPTMASRIWGMIILVLISVLLIVAGAINGLVLLIFIGIIWRVLCFCRWII